jgi:hypothetical protein
VGFLSFFRDSSLVQQNLVLEGLYKIRVTSMGDYKVLLQAEVPREIEKAQKEHQRWWKATFKKV